MYDWKDISKWKIIGAQNKTFLNLQTSHTFDCVFDHVKNRLADVTKNLFDLNIRDIEIPQADASWSRTNYTPKQMLDSSFLPRAVIMYNIDVNQEPIASIPSMDRFNRANIGMTYECCTIKQPRLRMPDGQWYDYMKDIDFSLVATPKYSTAVIFWSVLVNEHPLAIELVKQFKYHYPIGETNPIYNGFIQIKPPYGQKIPKPYLVEAYIPRQLVDEMGNMFQLDDNMELYNILRHHSHNRLEYKVMSGVADERHADFAVSYPSPIYLTPNSIDMIENTEGNLKYYGVKVEFTVNYMDLSTFRLTHSMKAINKDNPLLQVEKPVEHFDAAKGQLKDYVPVYEANFTQMINGTTIWDYFTVEYTEEDIESIWSEDQDKYITVAKTYVRDLPLELPIKHYLNMIKTNSTCKLNRSSYFNIEVKRTKRKFNEPWIPGTEADFEIDYNKMCVIDKRGKKDDSVYLAIYINKDHYSKWATKMGYLNPQNLTSLIGMGG